MVPTEATLHLQEVHPRPLERESLLLQGRHLQRRVHFQPHRGIPPLTRPRCNLLRSKTMETHLLLLEQHKAGPWSRGLAVQPRANAHVPAFVGFHRFPRVQELVRGEGFQVSLKSYSVAAFARRANGLMQDQYRREKDNPGSCLDWRIRCTID